MFGMSQDSLWLLHEVIQTVQQLAQIALDSDEPSERHDRRHTLVPV